MSGRDLHFIYLDRLVLDNPQWQHLDRFLYPAARKEDGDALVLGTRLDISHHWFVSVRAIDWAHRKDSRVILLRHNIVASIFEMPNHRNPPGFVDLNDARARLKVHS
ncbi:MAG: hypothetical protein LBI48_13115 [Burkholderiaceae bacterium]|jgi:hypothetical protein|nr:hypothetical protein [Burkholderiaceae bacterium]